MPTIHQSQDWRCLLLPCEGLSGAMNGFGTRARWQGCTCCFVVI